jgi:hypothetical protein
VNRVVWGFERNAWKLPPPFPGEQRDESPAGPQVSPGTYAVTVSYGGHEAKGTVRVLPDPRSQNTEADWQTRWAAIVRGGEMQEAASTAIERIARTRTDIDAVIAKAKERAEEERKAKGETAAKPPDPPIVMAAEKLKQKLADLEKRLWLSPDTKGIVDDDTVLGRIGYAEGAVGSAMTPPTPSQLASLRRAGATLEAFLVDFNRFYAEDVTAFRKAAAGERIELLPELPPLAVGGAAARP